MARYLWLHSHTERITTGTACHHYSPPLFTIRQAQTVKQQSVGLVSNDSDEDVLVSEGEKLEEVDEHCQWCLFYRYAKLK